MLTITEFHTLGDRIKAYFGAKITRAEALEIAYGVGDDLDVDEDGFLTPKMADGREFKLPLEVVLGENEES